MDYFLVRVQRVYFYFSGINVPYFNGHLQHDLGGKTSKQLCYSSVEIILKSSLCFSFGAQSRGLRLTADSGNAKKRWYWYRARFIVLSYDEV